MPFIYDLKLAESEPEYTFVQQLVPHGTLVEPGQPVATLTDGTMEYHLPAPRLGLLVQWFAEHGTEVQAGDVLARVVSEGEEVEVAGVEAMRLG